MIDEAIPRAGEIVNGNPFFVGVSATRAGSAVGETGESDAAIGGAIDIHAVCATSESRKKDCAGCRAPSEYRVAEVLIAE
jgi:hypothetical protein